MLLLHTLIDEFFNNDDAFTELNFVEVISILSINRFVFFPFEYIKSNLSENVLCEHSLFKKTFFLCLTKVSFVYPSLEYPVFLFDIWNGSY